MADNEELKDSVSLTNELVDNTKELGRLYKQNKENIKGLDTALGNMLSNSKGLNKQFENLTGLSDRLEKLEIKKNKIQDISNNLAAKRKIIEDSKIKLSETELQQQKDIAAQATESYKEVLEQIKKIEENKSYLNKKEREAQQRELKNLLEIKKIRGEEKDLRQEVVDALQNQVKLQDEALEATDTEIAALKEYEKKYDNITLKLGLAGRLLKGLQKIPLIGDLINAEDTLDAMRGSLKDNGSLIKAFGVGLKTAFEGIEKASIILIIVKAIYEVGKFLVETMAASSEKTTEVARQLMVVEGEASKLRSYFEEIKGFREDEYYTTMDLIEANGRLAKTIGLVGLYSKDLISNNVELVKFLKISEEAANNLSLLFISQNKSASEQTTLIYDNIAAYANQNGLLFKGSEILEETSQVSGVLRANFKGNAVEISKGVIQMKALGIELKKAKDAAESLLDFESSITSELEAELLLGKQFNFEQARYLSLTGDVAGAMGIVLKQVGSFENFSRLNRIQQDALAKAVGMTSDELADALYLQQIYQSTEGKLIKNRVDQLRATGKYEDQILASKLEQAAVDGKSLEEAEKSISAQDKFNIMLEKAKDIFSDMVGGGLLDSLVSLLEGIVDFAESVGLISHEQSIENKTRKALANAKTEEEKDRIRALSGKAHGGVSDKTGLAGAALGAASGFMIGGGPIGGLIGSVLQRTS